MLYRRIGERCSRLDRRDPEARGNRAYSYIGAIRDSMPTVKGRGPKVAVKHELGTKHRAAPVCVTSNNTFLTPVSTSHHISIRQAPSFTGTQLRSGRDSDRSGRSRQPTDWSLVCLQRGTPTRCLAWRGSHSRGGMKEQVSALLLPPHSRTHPCSAVMGRVRTDAVLESEQARAA